MLLIARRKELGWFLWGWMERYTSPRDKFKLRPQNHRQSFRIVDVTALLGFEKMYSGEKPGSKIWLLVTAKFLNFAVSIIIPAVFYLCNVNIFNCGNLTRFLQLLPLPNAVPRLCIYTTWVEWLEASFQTPLETNHWYRIHEAPANQMPLCTWKSLFCID